VTERQWQDQVTGYARARGWLTFHARTPAAQGWPDLCLVRDGRLYFAELKIGPGRVTRGQSVWLAALGDCPGVSAFVWRPIDWPEVQEVLR
jgi:hypothetical protein